MGGGPRAPSAVLGARLGNLVHHASRLAWCDPTSNFCAGSEGPVSEQRA
jgi:hypothetical protein